MPRSSARLAYSSSSSSAPASELTRPTVLKLLAPRRPLRDGSQSSRGSSSRSSSLSSRGLGDAPRRGLARIANAPTRSMSLQSSSVALDSREREDSRQREGNEEYIYPSDSSLSDLDDSPPRPRPGLGLQRPARTRSIPPAPSRIIASTVSRPRARVRSAASDLTDEDVDWAVRDQPSSPRRRSSRSRPAPAPTSILDVLDSMQVDRRSAPLQQPRSPVADVNSSQPFPRSLPATEMRRTGSANASSSNSSTTSDPVVIKPLPDRKRFTAKEKGKGKASIPTPIEVEDDDDDGGDDFEVTEARVGQKRKAEDEVDAVWADTMLQLDEEDEQSTDDGVDEERSVLALTCPICFSAPEKAVMTPCGHVLCAKCLLDSLLAAIKRNPNHFPGQPPTRGRGGRGGGRGGRGSRASGHQESWRFIGSEPGGPPEWTVESLKTARLAHLHAAYERLLDLNEVRPADRETYKQNDQTSPKHHIVVVKEMAKGFWEIDGITVVEGECPVCRKALPGGFAPPGIGMGNVVPIQLRIAGITQH